MSIADIVSMGYGSWGSVNDLPLMGYGLPAAALGTDLIITTDTARDDLYSQSARDDLYTQSARDDDYESGGGIA